MLTPPRRRSRAAITKVEVLEGRQLLAQAPPTLTVPPFMPAPMPSPTPPAPAPLGAPEVANAQFEPLTGRILVQFTADPAGYDPAVLTNPANYSFSLVQPFVQQPTKSQSRPKADVFLPPPYLITGVTLAAPLQPGVAPTVIVSINNNEPLRFGVYEFAIKSAGLVDLADRPLNGPYSGTFPTGNAEGGDFVTLLAETKNTVLPAIPLSSALPNPTPSGTAPSNVFLPSTRRIVVGYTSATPGKFMLAGGNKITLYALSFQNFPGTYRLPALEPSAIPGANAKVKSL